MCVYWLDEHGVWNTLLLNMTQTVDFITDTTGRQFIQLSISDYLLQTKLVMSEFEMDTAHFPRNTTSVPKFAMLPAESVFETS